MPLVVFYDFLKRNLSCLVFLQFSGGFTGFSSRGQRYDFYTPNNSNLLDPFVRAIFVVLFMCFSSPRRPAIIELGGPLAVVLTFSRKCFPFSCFIMFCWVYGVFVKGQSSVGHSPWLKVV